jgi:hypothetical protein
MGPVAAHTNTSTNAAIKALVEPVIFVTLIANFSESVSFFPVESFFMANI